MPTPTPVSTVPRAPTDGSVGEAHADSLFSSVKGDPPSSTEVETLASRLVGIDFAQLTRAMESPVSPKGSAAGEPARPQPLVLNLFDDVVFTGIVEHVEPTSSGHALWGRLDGVEFGTMTLVVNGNVVVGTVRTPHAVYTIRTAGDGVYVIRQIDESSLPPLGEPLNEPLPAQDARAEATNGSPDDGSEIDVMVAYTLSAKYQEGGRAAIEALIDLFVAEANQAYAISGVVHRIRLVLRKEVQYVDDGDSFIDVGRFLSDSDGYMDEVSALRDQYAADLVHLVVGRSDNVCGLAWVSEDESSAYALTVSYCGGLSFAHELGHNMGLNHDRYGADGPLTGANYGYVNQRMFAPDAPESARWRTIMAYVNQCWEVGEFDCQQLPYFSNPEKTYLGDPMGISADNPSTGVDGPADAVGSLNDRREVTSNFRRSSTSPTPRLGLTLSQYWLSENGGGSTVTAMLHRPSTSDTIVTVSASPADAITLSENRSLTIPAGQTTSVGIVTITGIDNGDATGDVMVTVSGTATNMSSLGVIDPDAVALAIADDESTPVVTLSLSRVAIFEGGDGNERRTLVTATLDNRSTAATTVYVSASPAEAVEEISPNPLIIPAGLTASVAGAIYAVDDSVFTGNKKSVTVSGTATNNLGVTGPESVTLTIVDDDAPYFAEDNITHTFTAGVAASRFLPEAVYGTGPLTYSISPAPSNGVIFIPGPPARIGISATSTVASLTSYTLTATDAEGDTDTLTVSITVLNGVCADSGAVSGYAGSDIVSDCEALLASRDILRGSQSLNWSEELPIAKWRGVSISDGRVVGINLSSGGAPSVELSGAVPSELGNLSNLRSLVLHWNMLTGPIPPELGGFANLQLLDLRWNRLTGPIPPELGSLSKLQSLYLNDNKLTGPIPSELGMLSELNQLSIGYNPITGPIPPELGGLTKLELLQLGSSQLTGSIPHGLVSLTELKSLDLSWSQLTGSIPPGLGSLTKLELLRLNRNQLTGSIPPELGDAYSLQLLDLSWNQLTGPIPPELGDAATLLYLFLDGNQLTEEIPPKLGSLAKLMVLSLKNNLLTGPIPMELDSLTNLQRVFLSDNQLTGCVPRGLRGVSDDDPNNDPDSDLDELGLPFCDVLLGSLAISPGELTPPFDPYHIHYIAVVSAPQVTVTSTYDDNTTLQFLDGRDVEIPDADTNLAGHQVDLSAGVNAISIRVVSEDGLATHTYTIRVNRASAPEAPVIIDAVPGKGSLAVSWTPPRATGGADIASYDVRHIESASADKSDASWSVATDAWPGGPLRYTIAGLKGDTPYDIQVRAAHGAGTGPWSETLVGTPEAPSACVTGGAVSDVTNTGLVADCEALLEARDVLVGSGSLNWSAGTPIAQWEGVTLRGTPERVGWLDLRAKGLDGSIPAELGQLSNLTYLNLRTNDLTGTIPASLGNFAKLRVLNLNGNDLTGTIPEELGNLASLREMWLHANDLTGPIPASLGNLANLEKLKLRNNRLSGPIPPTFGRLDKLEWLVVHNNELSGPIPSELGDMDSLQILWLGGNKLSGSIPPQLGGLSNLTQLHLRTNELTGAIPAELKDMANLRRLWVHQNQLSGSIPSELGGLASLEILNLRANMLSGSIPAGLGKLGRLKDLFLHDNRLEGPIPDELGDLANLRRLWLSQNRLTGSIPGSLGSLSILTQLNLHTNRLSGRIPPELGNLADTLTRLRLSNGNTFTGCIPSALESVEDNDLDQLGLEPCAVP